MRGDHVEPHRLLDIARSRCRYFCSVRSKPRASIPSISNIASNMVGFDHIGRIGRSLPFSWHQEV